MAKKKDIEPVVEEEIAVESEETEVVEEVIEQPKKTAKKSNKKAREDFIARKLFAINKMDNPAKAKRLSERVTSNRKG